MAQVSMAAIPAHRQELPPVLGFDDGQVVLLPTVLKQSPLAQ